MNSEKRTDPFKNWNRFTALVRSKLKQLENSSDWSGLEEKEQELLALWKLETAIQDAGFLHFFCNGGNACFLYARRGLLKMGATQSLEIIDKQYAIIYRTTEHYFDITLQNIPLFLTEEEKEKIQDLDHEYRKNSGAVREAIVRFYEKG